MHGNIVRFYKDKAIELADWHNNIFNTYDGIRNYPLPIERAKGIYDAYFSDGLTPEEKIRSVAANPSMLMESLYGQIVSYYSNNYDYPKFIKSFDYQLACFDTMKTKKNVAILSARQMGISIMLRSYALWYCLNHDNATVFFLTNSSSRATELKSDIFNLIDHMFFPYMDIIRNNRTELGFSNRSKIVSSHDVCRMRGSTINLLIVDDASQMKALDLNCLMPLVSSTNSQTIIANTGGFDDTNVFTYLVDNWNPEFIKLDYKFAKNVRDPHFDMLRNALGTDYFAYQYELLTPDWKAPS